MSDTIRGELEAAMAGESGQATEQPEPEESFEQFAARHVANGASLEAIHLMRLIETDFPYFQNGSNLAWAQSFLDSHKRNGWDLDNVETPRQLLAYLQRYGEESDRRAAARKEAQARHDATGKRLDKLAQLLAVTERIVDKRRTH